MSKLPILTLLLLSLLACRPSGVMTPAPAATGTATSLVVAQIGTVSAVDFCSRRVIGTLTPTQTSLPIPPSPTFTPSFTPSPSHTPRLVQVTLTPSSTPRPLVNTVVPVIPSRLSPTATATRTPGGVPAIATATTARRTWPLPTQPPPTGTPGTTLAMYTAALNAFFDQASLAPGTPIYISPAINFQTKTPMPPDLMHLVCVYTDNWGYPVLAEEPKDGVVLSLEEMQTRQVNDQDLPTIGIGWSHRDAAHFSFYSEIKYFALTYTLGGWKAEYYTSMIGVS